MAESSVIECGVAFPSIARALKLVPEEFADGYRWFQKHQDTVIPRLPFGRSTPSELTYPLARQSGIHSPSSKTMRYRSYQYAISVHSSDLGRYPDKAPIPLGDGTWVFDYSCQDNSPTLTHQDYNGWLLNCLEDGIPVGVMTRRKAGGYRVWGLAFIERYNPLSGMFTLRGPVDAATEAAGCFGIADPSTLSREDRLELGGGTEMERRFVRRLQMERREQFRRRLLDAYGFRCAISDANVPEALQASRMGPYRGIASQDSSSGLLLRADIHMLYDAHLLSVTPESHIVRISDRLWDSPYRKYHGRHINLPRRTADCPNDELLELQFRQFRTENTFVRL